MPASVTASARRDASDELARHTFDVGTVVVLEEEGRLHLFTLVRGVEDGVYRHLRRVADEHLRHSLPAVVADSYEGGHWLASFALLALGADEAALGTGQ